MAQMVKNLLAMQETWVLSLDGEDALEKEMATYSSILARRIPWIDEPGRLYSSWGRKELGMTQRLTLQSAQNFGPVRVPYFQIGNGSEKLSSITKVIYILSVDTEI